MKIEKRFQNQITNLLAVFEQVLTVHHQGRPVDNWLTRYFRQNRQFGSNDRRRVANSIFGFFRWYGWLRKLPVNDHSSRLLLGYLLDNNSVDSFTHYWVEQSTIATNAKALLGSLAGSSLTEKCALVSSLFGEVEISDLNPEFARDVSPERVAALQTRPGLWIRLLQHQADPFFSFLQGKGVDYTIHPRQPHCLAIHSPVNLFESPDYKLGNLEVQDISSQGVGLICKPEADDIWWDVCAGSGGKSLHLAALMNFTGNVYASETDRGRYRELENRLARNTRFQCIKPVFWDGDALPVFERPPRHVIVDAPCTGSGTWRRSPDLRWNTTRETIQHYAQLQQAILQLASQAVPKGGKLVYATCSLFHEENEQVVEAFLAGQSSFKRQSIECPFRSTIHSNGIRFLPPEIDGNGIFAALMIRRF